MQNQKIDTKIGVPIIPPRRSVLDDPFAFARRLRTAIWMFDIDKTCVLYANDAACTLWQAATEKELQQRNLSADMSPTVARRLKQYQVDFIERDESFSEMWTLYPNGKPTSSMVLFSGFSLPDGRMAMLCEVLGNTVNEPNNLRSAEALLHTDVMISLYEVDGPALYMNPAARTASPDGERVISEKFVDQACYREWADELQKTGQHRMISKVHTAQGTRWHDLSTKTCSDAVTGRPVLLETAIDVTELKDAKDTARYLADRDLLTGCFNRTFLTQYISRLKSSPDRKCALLTLDVDRFKRINDSFGHEGGDVVLKGIVDRIGRSIRKSDVIIRLGGDEFVVVLKDTPSETDLIARIECLRKNLAGPVQYEATKIDVSVSIGVTSFCPKTANLTAIMREADIALYASKQSGRDCVTYFSQEMGLARDARNAIESQLKQSIADNDFVLNFQPRIDLKTNQIVSAEALVRWQHPERGLVMPGDFIPICEETGLIEELGQLILEMGCQQSAQWHRTGLDLDLSVNISPRQFADKGLLEALERFSRDPDFSAGTIELEITESVLIGDLDEIEEKLRTISGMGYRIAIDDFGTGYSNLAYISKFPLDCLKIDQSFISQLPKSGPIVSLILTLAKQMGATVVAEGVETQEQSDWLAEHGCDQIQGYLISRPVPINEFHETLRTLNLPAQS